jgi:hypothetical protein
METILDLIKYIIPALVVFGSVYYIMRQFYDKEDKKYNYELRKEAQKKILPLQIQAYERLILFMERISPENIVLRLHKKGMTAHQLHSELTANVNEEFEHNLTQQTYVSHEAWSIVRASKDEILHVFNESIRETKPDGTGIDLGQTIFNKMSKRNTSPTHDAIRKLKEEFKLLF